MPKFNKNQYTLNAVYKHYKTTTTKPVTFKEHKLILDTWGQKVNEYLLLGKDVKLHSGLSLLGIRKKVKKTFINKRESKLQKTLVKSSNVHSGFYGASVYWRRHYTAFNSNGWVFYPTRELNRALGKVMLSPQGHTRYSKRAIAAGSQEKAKAIYNKNVLKL
jgi:hypothetical protein